MNLPFNQKSIVIVAVSLAVIVAAIAAIVVSANRADEAKAYAEAEFAKYRIVQDKLFMSDYDRYLLALEEEAKKAKGESL